MKLAADKIAIYEVRDIDSGGELVWVARGTHDPALFAEAIRRYESDAALEVDPAKVTHETWRSVPARDELGYRVTRSIAAKPGSPGGLRGDGVLEEGVGAMSVDTDKSRAWAQDVIRRAERSATVEGEMSLATIGAYLSLMAESLEEVSPLARTVIAQANRIEELESSLKLAAEDAERWHRLFDEGASTTAKIAAELEAAKSAETSLLGVVREAEKRGRLCGHLGSRLDDLLGEARRLLIKRGLIETIPVRFYRCKTPGCDAVAAWPDDGVRGCFVCRGKMELCPEEGGSK